MLLQRVTDLLDLFGYEVVRYISQRKFVGSRPGMTPVEREIRILDLEHGLRRLRGYVFQLVKMLRLMQITLFWQEQINANTHRLQLAANTYERFREYLDNKNHYSLGYLVILPSRNLTVPVNSRVTLEQFKREIQDDIDIINNRRKRMTPQLSFD